MCFSGGSSGGSHKKTTVHGYWVEYDEDAYNGIYYLKRDLDREESSVFFEHARLKGESKFEDDRDRQYTLVYKKYKNYLLTRRDGR